jgi:3,4-dihydroxy 2-butanone 4-phosphate synthase / GTP cyclohydrolase II
MAQPGGVLTRAGHTEAGCDLARLAGCEPAAVIVEILNEDGTMARRPDLERFAAEHGLKIGTIADLIRYRLHKERSVERVSDQQVDTEFGRSACAGTRTTSIAPVHVALVRGDPSSGPPPLVRVHLKDTLRDLIGVKGEGSAGPCARAAAHRAGGERHRDPAGRRRRRARSWSRRATLASASGHEAGAAGPGGAVLRTYGIGAQILKDLGVSRMRVLSSPKQMLGISAFGLEVTDYVD